MLEKIKDILYDISDIVVSLVIVALIFFVVSWKISDSLAFDVTIPEQNTQTQVAGQDPNIIEISEVPDAEAKPLEETSGEAETTKPNETAPPQETVEATPSTDAKPGGTQVNLVGVTKEIEIKSGSSGYSIGKLLATEGLVADTNTFIKRVEELGLGAKLRSGTFTLSSDMSLDEIIYKISGQ